MTHLRLAARCVLVVAIAGGCGGEVPMGSSDAGIVTLADLEAHVFSASCAFSTCHSGGSPAGALDLEGSSRDALVGVPSSANTGRILVVPGDVEGSYLYRKLADDPPEVGDRMPIGSPLEPARLELVRAWIANGALE
jgi:hypothetical protein